MLYENLSILIKGVIAFYFYLYLKESAEYSDYFLAYSFLYIVGSFIFIFYRQRFLNCAFISLVCLCDLLILMIYIKIFEVESAHALPFLTSTVQIFYAIKKSNSYMIVGSTILFMLISILYLFKSGGDIALVVLLFIISSPFFVYLFDELRNGFTTEFSQKSTDSTNQNTNNS